MEAFKPVSGSGRRWFHLYRTHDMNHPCNEALCGVTAEWGDADNRNWGEVDGDLRCPRCAAIWYGTESVE